MKRISKGMRNRMRNYNLSQQPDYNCSCGGDFSYNITQDEFVVAMAYVPWQNFTEMCDPEKGLQQGTIFPELDLPFYGGKAGRRR